MYYYDEGIQTDIIDRLIDSCGAMKDADKIQIKNTVRHLIYEHRYFSDSDWSMEERQLKNYERILDVVKMEDDVYDYVYLIFEKYDFPLLQPVPLNKEGAGREFRQQNKILREKEIVSKFKSFKYKQLSIEMFIHLGLQVENSILGEVLAEFYCKGIYNEQVLSYLLEKDCNGKHIYRYISFFVLNRSVDLKFILNKVRHAIHNNNLIVDLISLEIIEDHTNTLIAKESDLIKKVYWEKNSRYRISDNAGEEVVLWALQECHKYGDLESYLELLFDLKEKLTDIQLYEALMIVEDMTSKSVNRSMTEYRLNEILKPLQKTFLGDEEKCLHIAWLEWLFRNVLEWNQMKCMQYMMKVEPVIYANLIQIIYKSSDSSDVVDEEKSQLANKVFLGFEKAKFCPTEVDGVVKYDKLKQWIERFKELLIEQKQENLFELCVGKLLTYSPVGEDGFMPCEAVREIIEEYYNDSLKSAYVIAEQNKRGVHMVDAGKSEIESYVLYKENAVILQNKYPHTAEIYYELSDVYKKQADDERRLAEDEW